MRCKKVIWWGTFFNNIKNQPYFRFKLYIKKLILYHIRSFEISKILFSHHPNEYVRLLRAKPADVLLTIRFVTSSSLFLIMTSKFDCDAEIQEATYQLNLDMENGNCACTLLLNFRLRLKACDNVLVTFFCTR